MPFLWEQRVLNRMSTERDRRLNGKAHDLTGQKFEGWTALHRTEKPQHLKSGTFWMCACECGETKKPLSRAILVKHRSKSCGCRRKTNRVGQRFGKWKVLDARREGSETWAVCLCDCGTKREVLLPSLVFGASKSCGCGRGFPNPDQAPITKILDSYKRQASDMGRSWELDRETASKLLKSDCYYCGAPPRNCLKSKQGFQFYYTGIDRTENSKGYTLDNVVPACRICNLAKHTTHQDEFLSTVKAIYEHLDLQNRILLPVTSERFHKSNETRRKARRWNGKRRKAGQKKRAEEKFIFDFS